MERASKAETCRTQARACAAMAQSAPTAEIKAYWLALADGYQKAAKSLERPAPRCEDRSAAE